jgi:preprotein translocase subunit SecF
MLNIIGNRKIYLTVSGILVGASILAIVLFGFHRGIDFLGGTLWQFKAPGSALDASAVQSFLADNDQIKDARASYDAVNGSFLVRLPSIDEATHQKLISDMKAKYPSFDEMSYQSIGPTVGQELENNSIIALILVLIGISLYIAYAFRKVFRPVSSWKYGWITLFTLIHDVSIPAGLLAVLGRYAGVEIDGNFVVALLVVMGFSVHDTIVVFDRIRENLLLDRGKAEFGALINTSVNQTLGRSINTSLTLILVLLALYFAGPANLHYFVLTLLVGVTTGIYSSIFVASPLLLVWQRLTNRQT